jgi:hypothetical protein
MRTLNLSEEQKKTLKLFSYYCASHGAKEATLTCYLLESGSIDWIDNTWYSDSGVMIETYDKIKNLVEFILEETDILDYYDYEGLGSLQFELDIPEKKLSITGYHREYDTNHSSLTWEGEDFGDTDVEINSLFESLNGEMGILHFEGGGDSGWIEDSIVVNGGSIECPKWFRDWCYDCLANNFGGWEINEGSQGEFNILSKEKMIELNFGQNIEDEISDGVVGYVEF